MRYEIPGIPIHKMRPKLRGQFFYDPQDQERLMVKECIMLQKPVLKPQFEPIFVKMTFHMQIPKSWSKKARKSALGKPHTKRPDVDNLCKFYLDALNGILWHDDAQIYKLQAEKVYADIPSTLIELA